MIQRKIIEIPATKSRYTAQPIMDFKKRRVAGYARVSTDHADQVSSYEAQVAYYTDYIKRRSDWEFAGIYTNEGISGTNTRRREGFNNMVRDALEGKIDLIVTKSVSRFARNTVDSLTTIRNLKEKNVEVYFEKENIWTMDSKGELLITIMSSLAQEESRSISENITWGKHKQAADGKVSFSYGTFLGLDKDPVTGKLVVNPKQAETVRLIFRLFLEGMTAHSIAKELTLRGIKTPKGLNTWNQTTIKSILSNEKYKGDVLLQKEYTVDYLQGKMKKNTGEVPQYYIQGNHEAIISPVVFDLVQVEVAKRLNGPTRYSGLTIFTSKIKCADCGGWYGKKVWHSNDKYRKVVYRCNNKYRAKEKCRTAHVTEEEIQAAFVSAYNKLMTRKEEFLANAEIIQKTLCETEALQEEKNRLAEQMTVLSGMIDKLVAHNASVAQNQEEYRTQYNELVKQHAATKERYDQVVSTISAKEMQRVKLVYFTNELKGQHGLLHVFDCGLWSSLVDFVTVGRKKEITVTFKDGTEIRA